MRFGDAVQVQPGKNSAEEIANTINSYINGSPGLADLGKPVHEIIPRILCAQNFSRDGLSQEVQDRTEAELQANWAANRSVWRQTYIEATTAMTSINSWLQQDIRDYSKIFGGPEAVGFLFRYSPVPGKSPSDGFRDFIDRAEPQKESGRKLANVAIERFRQSSEMFMKFNFDRLADYSAEDLIAHAEDLRWLDSFKNISKSTEQLNNFINEYGSDYIFDNSNNRQIIERYNEYKPLIDSCLNRLAVYSNPLYASYGADYTASGNIKDYVNGKEVRTIKNSGNEAYNNISKAGKDALQKHAEEYSVLADANAINTDYILKTIVSRLSKRGVLTEGTPEAQLEALRDMVENRTVRFESVDNTIDVSEGERIFELDTVPAMLASGARFVVSVQYEGAEAPEPVDSFQIGPSGCLTNMVSHNTKIPISPENHMAKSVQTQFKEMYDTLNNVDEALVRSSPQFRNMKALLSKMIKQGANSYTEENVRQAMEELTNLGDSYYKSKQGKEKFSERERLRYNAVIKATRNSREYLKSLPDSARAGVQAAAEFMDYANSAETLCATGAKNNTYDANPKQLKPGTEQLVKEIFRQASNAAKGINAGSTVFSNLESIKLMNAAECLKVDLDNYVQTGRAGEMLSSIEDIISKPNAQQRIGDPAFMNNAVSRISNMVDSNFCRVNPQEPLNMREYMNGARVRMAESVMEPRVPKPPQAKAAPKMARVVI